MNLDQEKDKEARISSFVGAIALSELVSPTLGPKGMDKILQSMSNNNEISVTNDGATILKSIHMSNPAAKILIEISKVQDDQVGDGTTSVVVLAGELLREAKRLIELKIHPQIIISGFRKAKAVALKALEKASVDKSKDKEAFRKELLKLAGTTLSSKILKTEKDKFSEIAVDAVLRLKGSTNLESIQILKKKGGSLKDSYIEEGFILDKKIGVGQPKRLENAKIMVANTPMDTDKIKIFGTTVKVDSSAKVAEIEKAERDKMINKCKKIVAHGINCFINRQLIYNLPEQYFTDNGVLSIEHADFSGIERLALVTGAEIVSTFDNPEKVKLGTAKLIEEIMIGEDKLIRISGCPDPAACTIVLRGSSGHILDEAERSLHDALAVLSQVQIETRTVYGGGCIEVLMAKDVEEEAKKVSGKESLAVEAFANALRQIPKILCDNAGFDSNQIVAQLKAEHYKGNVNAGVDMNLGCIGDMQQLGVVESYKVKYHALLSATEAAEMILRVDNIIKSQPRRK
ncbi:t-complex protein 1 subunit beta [Anaeramoeba ignava]|uniref:CCT-beta n=1 Tax=Anaeramoeba ignava TaxID=1746090 RepID=A0A9Q0LJ01_ANAIG|nr:t-complex protein 1 subunit beta [Anaeramoeba ignava]